MLFEYMDQMVNRLYTIGQCKLKYDPGFSELTDLNGALDLSTGLFYQ